jgi:adenylate cyclase
MDGIKKLIFAVIFGVSVAGIIYTVSQTMGYRHFLRVQNAIDDSHFVYWKKKAARIDDIVVIDINDSSLAALGNFKRWPRRHFGEVITRVAGDGARMVFLDVILMRGGLRRDNERLVNSIAETNNVILGYYFSLDSKNKRRRPLDPVYNEKFAMSWFSTQRIEKNEFIRAGAVNLPFPELVRSAAGIGFTNYIPDPDGVLRHIPLYIAYNNTLFPSAALQLWLHLHGEGHSHAEISPRGTRFGKTFIPTDKHSFMRLNYRGAGHFHPTFSFADVLRGRFRSGTFRNKIVMIGSSSSGLGDLKKVPGHKALPGVEIHAAALSTLLGEEFLTVVSGNTVFFFTLLCGVLISILFAFYPPFLVGIPATLAAPLVLYIYSVYCFVYHSELFNISIPSLTILFIGIVLAIHRLIEHHGEAPEAD